MESEELLERENNLIAANIRVDEYDPVNGVLPVYIIDIQDANNHIEAIKVAVWSEEDQSDLQWIESEKQEDGSYFVGINMQLYTYKPGEYKIHAYAVVDNGDDQYLNSSTGIIQ